MNKTLPYTVPDGFLEMAQERALKGAARVHRRRVLFSSATGIIAAIAIVFGVFLTPSSNVGNTGILASAFSDDEIIEAYEADIFLRTFDY